MFGRPNGISKLEEPTSVDKVSGGTVSLRWTRSSITMPLKLWFSWPQLSTRTPSTNHGVSETSNYSMKLRKLVQYSTVSVTLKEPHSNSVQNPPTSPMTISPPRSDQSRFPLKAEWPFMRTPTTTERRLFTLRMNPASNHLT